MDPSETQVNYHFGEKELAEYSYCPDVAYMGGHLGGMNSCPYCAEIFRRYRIRQNEKLQFASARDPERGGEDDNEEANTKKLIQSLNQKEDVECTKLMCMRAGWCVCGN